MFIDYDFFKYEFESKGVSGGYIPVIRDHLTKRLNKHFSFNDIIRMEADSFNFDLDSRVFYFNLKDKVCHKFVEFIELDFLSDLNLNQYIIDSEDDGFDSLSLSSYLLNAFLEVMYIEYLIELESKSINSDGNLMLYEALSKLAEIQFDEEIGIESNIESYMNLKTKMIEKYFKLYYTKDK